MPIGSDFDAGGIGNETQLKLVATQAFNLQRKYQDSNQPIPDNVQREIDSLIEEGERLMAEMKKEGASGPDLRAMLEDASLPLARPEVQIPMTVGQENSFRAPQQARFTTSTGQEVHMLRSHEKLTDRVKPNTGGLNFGGFVRSMIIPDSRYRAMLTQGDDSAGGYTVPSVLMPGVIDHLRSALVLNNAGITTMVLPDAGEVAMARLDEDIVPSWRHETVEIVSQDLPKFGQVRFYPRVVAAEVVASRELLADSINVESALTTSFTNAIALAVDAAGLMGTGTGGEPQGILHTPGIGSVDMGANGAAIADYNPFIDAAYELTSRNSPAPSAYIANPRTVRDVGKLVDSTGQPLMPPKQLENTPILSTTSIPITDSHGSANDASRVYAGAWDNLVLGIRMGLMIETLREKYSSTYSYGFLASMRLDFAVLQPACFATIDGIIE